MFFQMTIFVLFMRKLQASAFPGFSEKSFFEHRVKKKDSNFQVFTKNNGSFKE